MTPTRHESERLTDLVDDRLTAADAAAVRAHLAECPTCQADFARLRSARAALRARRVELASVSLRDAVRAALDREDAARASHRGGYAWRWGIAAAAAVFVVVAGFWWTGRTTPETLVADARANHDAVASAGLRPDAWVTPQASVLAAAFAGHRDTLPPIRVIDLAMMGWPIEGGQIVRVAGRSAALYSYRRADGVRMICHMFEGALDELPSTGDVRRHRGFTFRVYERDGVTLVFWQEGGVVCVLASRLPPADVVQLAFDKAMQPG